LNTVRATGGTRKLLTFVKEAAGDSLHRNSLLLTLAHALGAFFGFVLWVVAARFYPAADVGVATAVISTVSLLVTLSGLGLGFGIIRYLPEEGDRRGLINSSVGIAAFLSAALAIIFVAGVAVWSPALRSLQQASTAIIFILVAVSNSLFTLQTSIFIALRSAQFTLIQALLFALRIPLVIAMYPAGVSGIYVAFVAAFIIADAVSFYLIARLLPGYRPQPALRMKAIKKIFRFSMGNYLGDGLRLLPVYLLPIVVVNILSPDVGAYFYASWMIANLLFSFSYYTGLSVVAEVASDREGLGRQVVKAGKLILFVLTPGVLIAIFLGGLILSLFGERYAVEGFGLLRVLALASIPVALNELFVGIKRVERSTKQIMVLYGFVAAATIIGGYFLVGSLGLVGIGLAYLGANFVAMVAILPAVVTRIRGRTWIKTKLSPGRGE